MKTAIFIAAFGATMVLSCASASAQGTNRVPNINQGADAVDASVHADAEEQGLQERQLSQEHVKLPTTYSRWAFNFSGQPLATQSWGAHTIIIPSIGASGDGESPSILSPSFQAGARPLPSTVWSVRSSAPQINMVIDRSSGEPERQLGLFRSLENGRTQYDSTGPQRVKTTVLPLSPQQQADGFSAPLRENQFSLASDSSLLPHVFPKTTSSSQRYRATASRRKSHPKKSLESKHTGTSTEFSSDREKPGRSRLTTKAD